MTGRLLAGCVVACATFLAGPAEADTDACVDAYAGSQRLRRAGKLLDAEKATLACMAETCPALLRKDCLQWLDEIRAAQPGLIISVTGKDGCDRSDARVYIDGTLATSVVDGGVLRADPGRHDVRVEIDDAPPDDQPVVLTEGEHARRHAIRFAPADSICGAPRPAPPTRTIVASRPTPALAYVLGGIGVVSLATGSGFAVAAWSQKSELDDCRPSCESSAVDSMRLKFGVADVLFATSIVTLAAATWLILTRPEITAPADRRATASGAELR